MKPAARPAPRKVAALSVDADGRVVKANQAALDQYPGCVGRKCADVVALKNTCGSPVCGAACWQHLVAEGGARDVEGVVHGDSVRLVCTVLDPEGPGQVGTVIVLPKRVEVATDVSLSPRETEVLGRLVEGWSAIEIADRLGIGASTVRTHIDHLKEKLGVRKNTEVVSKAIALGLVEGW